MEQEKVTSTLPLLSSEAAAALYAMAYNAYQNGNYRDAAACFRLLAGQTPRNKAAWMGLGASLQMLKDYSEAVNAYGLAAILDETDPYIHFHAAECYRALDDNEKALMALSSALACKPDKNFKDQLLLLLTLWSQGGSHES